MAKRLVINADDFGLAEGVNRGIIECRLNGAVTDISMLAVGDSFAHAAETAGKNGIKKLGAHLALTDSFRPAASAEGVPTLVGGNGRFAGSYGAFLTRYFTGRVSESDIYTEFKNQISKLKKEGFELTHLNSHQHVHMIPGILKIALRLMKEEKIGYVRFPLEKMDIFNKLVNPGAWSRNLLLSSMCRISGGLLRQSGIGRNDYFIGHASAFGFDKDDLVRAISGLKNGLTELSCHPGLDYEGREKEVKTLFDTGFINELKNNSVELVSY